MCRARRLPGIDPGDFFNYGQSERGWRQYCQRVQQYRLEFFMKSQIQTLGDTAQPGGAGAAARARRPNPYEVGGSSALDVSSGATAAAAMAGTAATQTLGSMGGGAESGAGE